MGWSAGKGRDRRDGSGQWSAHKQADGAARTAQDVGAREREQPLAKVPGVLMYGIRATTSGRSSVRS